MTLIMKQCPHCGSLLVDDAIVCTNCGLALSGEQQEYYTQDFYSAVSSYDHTQEFSDADVSDNKVACMAAYLMGVLGLIIASLVGKDSKYVAFHIKQALKITVLGIILFLFGVVFVWTFIIPMVVIVCLIILFVLRLIAFFQVCRGKAYEPSIVRDLNFIL